WPHRADQRPAPARARRAPLRLSGGGAGRLLHRVRQARPPGRRGRAGRAARGRPRRGRRPALRGVAAGPERGRGVAGRAAGGAAGRRRRRRGRGRPRGQGLESRGRSRILGGQAKEREETARRPRDPRLLGVRHPRRPGAPADAESPGAAAGAPAPPGGGPSERAKQVSDALPAYRTHTCGELRAGDVGRTVRLSGWVHRKRDHGGLLFIDLRDHYGLTQCVFHAGSPALAGAEAVRLESVITVTGAVVAREPSAVNPKLPTGEVEVAVRELTVQSGAEPLPLQVNSDAEF